MGSGYPEKSASSMEELPMTSIPRLSILASTMLLSLGLNVPGQAQQAPDMTFFVTSVGPGKGGDLGGLAGADAYCQTLAATAGAGGKTWRAYLSTNAALLAGRSTPAIASGAARGRTSRATWSPRASTISTVPTTSFRARRRSPRRAPW